MPSPWLPGATVDPGRNAGYAAGRNSMQLAVNHYTVGADSRSIARAGYFHVLVHQSADREAGCTQYAECDAVTFHAGGSSGMPDANQRGPGIEYERRVIGPPGDDGISEAEPLTANQLAWGTRIVEWLEGWGIPPVLYDGPRYGARDWSGWVNHHDLDRDRSDGLTGAEWQMITAGGTLPPASSYPEDVDMDSLATEVGLDGTVYVFVVTSDDSVWVTEKPPGGTWPGGFSPLNGTVRK